MHENLADTQAQYKARYVRCWHTNKMYSEDSAIAEMIMQQPQGGRPKSHWPDDKKTGTC